MNENRIGENITKYRAEHNMTQRELSSAVGVTPNTVSLWETGTTQPRKAIAYKLSKLFDVSVDEFIEKK